MRRSILHLLRCVLLKVVSVEGLSTWTYGEGPVGPDKWGGQCKDGRSQSPVNLEPNTSKPIERWSFSFSYRYKVPCTIVNNGNTLKFSFNMSKPASISGGNLAGEFVLSHGMFHWGSTDTEGSEHLVRGRSFPLEIHLVHYNSKYQSYRDSVGKPDGLAVFAVLHELADTDNNKLSPIINSLTQITNPGSTFTLEKSISPRDILPIIASPLYRYTGSLTSPPCTELVTWTVFYHTNTVSGAQLSTLRSLLKTDGTQMDKTFRQTARLNSRSVNIGAAYLAEKVTPRTATEATEIIRTQKDYLQLSLRSAEPSWYEQPAPMWTVLVGGVLVLVAGTGLLTFFVVKKLKETPASHERVPTDDIELEDTL
eukprot:GFUD01003833.1.p1 GENE.GFUD01003833.1~~GFUD01003833.1.p1  ORF type:complete len:367 (-),score=77.33 GFUD01003833.1:162-1262(-)